MAATAVAPAEALYLGIDIGSSSSKGVLVDQAGRIRDEAHVAHAVSRPRPGWAEQDAESVWWSDCVTLARELTSRATRPLTAVGVSGIGPCFLPVDGAGTPLRPAILYGVDTRAQREVAELTERFGADVILARGGSALSSQAVGPKMLWVRRNEPEVWTKTRRFLMSSSFLVERLTGRYVLDHHSASQCDPLYDLAAEAWIRDWADEVAPGLELPPLAWSDEIAGTVTPQAAAMTGIAAGTPVSVGTIDAWAEALSVGVRSPGDTMLMYGTTMFIVSVTDRVVPHPAMWATAGVSAGSRTYAAGMATSGALLGGSASWSEACRSRSSSGPPPQHLPAPTAWWCSPTSPGNGRRSSTRTPAALSLDSPCATVAPSSTGRSSRARPTVSGTSSKRWPSPARAPSGWSRWAVERWVTSGPRSSPM